MMVKSPGKLMNKQIAVIVLFLTIGLIQSTASVAQGLPEYWERDSAMTAAESVDLDRGVHQIASVSTLSDAHATLTGLREVEAVESGVFGP